MNIKELAEKGHRAFVASQSLVREMAGHEGAWPAEKQTAYDALILESTTAMAQVKAEQLRAEQVSGMEQFYNQPNNTGVRAPVVEVNSNRTFGVKEAFSQYVAQDKAGGTLLQAGVEAFADENGIADPEPLIKRCVEIHKRAFRAYLHGERDGLREFAETQKVVNPREVYALLSNDKTLGGFTVPVDFQAEVIKAEAGFAQIRALARVQPTNRDTLVWPKIKPHATDSRRTSGFGGLWRQQVAGGLAGTRQDQPTFQEERIPVHDWVPYPVEVSNNLLEDSAVSIEQILAEVIAETKAIDEDDVFLSGTGVGQPEGILTAGITQVASGSGTDWTYNGFLNFYFSVPVQYRNRADFMFTSMSFGNLMKLNTGTGGVYLFPPNTFPTNLLGRPFHFHEGMTSPVAGVFTVNDKVAIFGDFKRYIIAERQGLRVMRLDQLFPPNVAFLPIARIGGQVVLSDAFRIQKISA